MHDKEMLFLAQLSDFENQIFNKGERLIPNVTHNRDELVRHKSSYLFFYRIIEKDLTQNNHIGKTVRIIDLGCGVGHGCHMLSRIPNSEVVGVDISQPSLDYAQKHYSGTNIQYHHSDLEDYINSMPEFDYAVSRNCLEHISNGLQLALLVKWKYRLMVDVPYNEPERRNSHHLINRINDSSFADYPQAELLFQDLAGTIYDTNKKPPNPNIIICVCSHPELPKINDTLEFPLSSWTEDLEPRGI